MKTLVRLVVLIAIIGGIAFGVYWYVNNQTPPLEERPAGTAGSFDWAYDMALVRARSELDTDAVLVEVEGRGLFPDGRLAANTGTWILDFSSFNAASRIPITVNHLGDVTVGESRSPGSIRSMGNNPTNSTTIFAATVGHGESGTRTVIDPVVAEYDDVAGTHVWTIQYRVNDTTETHRVRDDGVWLTLNG